MATRTKEALGKRIARLRRRAELSQVALAAESGISPDSIRKIEQGVTTDLKSSTAIALAAVLGVPVSTVLGVE